MCECERVLSVSRVLSVLSGSVRVCEYEGMSVSVCCLLEGFVWLVHCCCCGFSRLCCLTCLLCPVSMRACVRLIAANLLCGVACWCFSVFFVRESVYVVSVCVREASLSALFVPENFDKKVFCSDR